LIEPTVYILIVNWNGWRDTIQCLESLRMLNYPNYSVVLIDNGSEDNSLEHIRNWCKGYEDAFLPGYFRGRTRGTPKPIYFVEYDCDIVKKGRPIYPKEILENNFPLRLIIIKNDRNIGFPAACNAGLRYGISKGADYVWILNNDTVVHPDALDSLVKKAIGEPRCALIGSRIQYYDAPDKTWFAGGGRFNPILGISWRQMDSNRKPFLCYNIVVGCSMFVRIDAVKDVGLMDESLFICCEEIDWNMRFLRKGWGTGYEPASIVWHKVSQSLESTSPLRDYYNSRNFLRISLRWFPLTFPFIMVLFLGTIFLPKMIRFQKRRFLMSLLGFFHFIVGKSGKLSG
jgi:GT2 family glycosyltransferase